MDTDVYSPYAAEVEMQSRQKRADRALEEEEQNRRGESGVSMTTGLANQMSNNFEGTREPNLVFTFNVGLAPNPQASESSPHLRGFEAVMQVGVEKV